MASWNWPKLPNKISTDVPYIQQALVNAIKFNPTPINDIPIEAKRLYEVSTGKVQFQKYNESSTWVDIGKLMHDVDTVDGFHASQSAAKNAIAVRDSNGKLSGDLLGNANTSTTATKLATGTVVPVNQGGTGATTSTDARTNLGAAIVYHKDTKPTYGVGDSSSYGHLKLSDSTNSSSNVDGGVAATPKAIKDLKTVVDDIATDLEDKITQFSQNTTTTLNDVVKITGTQTISGVKTFATYCYGTTPSMSDNSTKIPTTNWVRQCVTNAVNGIDTSIDTSQFTQFKYGASGSGSYFFVGTPSQTEALLIQIGGITSATSPKSISVGKSYYSSNAYVPICTIMGTSGSSYGTGSSTPKTRTLSSSSFQYIRAETVAQGVWYTAVGMCTYSSVRSVAYKAKMPFGPGYIFYGTDHEEESNWCNENGCYLQDYESPVLTKNNEGESVEVPQYIITRDPGLTVDERMDYIREIRDVKLRNTDGLLLEDFPITKTQKDALLRYRQELRDLPQQKGFPWIRKQIPWPKEPDVVSKLYRRKGNGA